MVGTREDERPVIRAILAGAVLLFAAASYYLVCVWPG